MRAPFAPPRLSEPRNVDADAQAADTRSETERPDARIFEEPSRDLLIGRIEAQRQIGGQHGGHALLRLIERVRYGGLAVLGLPLFRSRRTGRQLPFVLKQVLEEQVAPLGWRLRPNDLWTAAS